jgi:hypothetical protein
VTPADTSRSGGGHGTLLKRKIEIAGRLLASPLDAFWNHPGLGEIFPQFLLAIHGSVRATIPLMEAAITVAGRRSDTDPICARLVPYFLQHIEEERGHEEWLLQDLEAVGVGRNDVFGCVPNATIAGIAGAQYYWIFHVHPVALLGFFAVLEGNPPVTADLMAIQERTGLPAAAFRMLRYHAEVDLAHAADIYSLLDSLPLSTLHTQLVGISALHTLAMLESFFHNLAHMVSRPTVPA